MTASGYGPGQAARHLLRGALAPRQAMREARASGLGEAGRCLLFLGCAAAVTVIDPSEGSVPRLLADLFAAGGTLAEAAPHLARWAGIAAALMLGLYLLTASVLWLATRPARAAPSHATIRSALAVGSWVDTLPVIALGLVFHLLGLDAVADLLLIALGAAFVGICLSEATGLDARAAMGLTMGALVLTGLILVVLLVLVLGPDGAGAAEQPGLLPHRIAP